MASPIQNSDQGGKRQGQEFKSLLVWQSLLKYTDEDHAASAAAIKEHQHDQRGHEPPSEWSAA